MRDLISDYLRHHPKIRAAAQELYCRLGGLVYRTQAEWLHAVFGTRRGVYFVQIGACDGKTDDAIYPLARSLGWQGVLVEPVPHLYERLVQNYSGASGIVFENAAISRQCGETTLYRLRETSDPTPRWAQQIGSLDRNVVLSHRHAIPNIERYLVEEKVRCITFQALAQKHKFEQIDVLLIDTEGHDFQVLQQIDLTRFCPKLVIYEEKHLSHADTKSARCLLRKNGYTVHPLVGMNAAAARN